MKLKNKIKNLENQNKPIKPCDLGYVNEII